MDQITQMTDDVSAPTMRLPDAPRARREWLTPRLVGSLAFIVVLLVNVVGYGAVWGFSAYTTETTARADLNLRVARLQALASSGGKALTPKAMAQAQTDLTAVDHDLRQLQSLLPLGAVSPIEPEASISHALGLGIDAVDAALAGLKMAQLLTPVMVTLIASVTHGAAQAPPANDQPLTPATIAAAQPALTLMTSDWAMARVERQYISPSALQSLGDPRFGKLLARFDQYAPTVTLALATASATLDWSATALGLTTPFHALLFNMDTDELRATGGFLGNYAELTLSQGRLVSGVHLHDIYTLDCPNNVCRTRAIPTQFSWFPLSQTDFGVRDSNLNPDFSTAAGLASVLYQQTTGTRVDAVIAITPAIIEDVLRVTGPITVPQYKVKITADNLTATIHYYHQNPNVTVKLGVNYNALGTSVFKAFDVLLSQALMARLNTLSAHEQSQLAMLMVSAFATKDIQLFVNNTRLEALLQQAQVAGQILAPSYDNLMVVDTNDGASYANADMQESVSDAVTLDAAGGAMHTLTISYYYRATSHTFSQKDVYEDFVRVLVPHTVGYVAIRGPCTPKATIQSYHTSAGCQLSLQRGRHATVTFTWRTPNAFTAGKLATYRLLIQRQAGAQVSMQVGITPPSGQDLHTQTSGLTPAQGQLIWSAQPLLRNTTLAAQVG